MESTPNTGITAFIIARFSPGLVGLRADGVITRMSASRLPGCALAVPQRPERDRVAKFLGGRNRVLPRPSRLAGEHVAGPGIEPDLPHPAIVALAALEPEPASAAERHADHRPE